ncbi:MULTISPECIES: class F sortase [unclassified Streptomyces]|uniref:class F sortase n=1 Tax=unclassified Streptomyces TaxID=2593676 RepID=UPI0007462FAE|nr:MULTISPECIES: class F sortase [unclassified Streptomyces]KUL76565.1 sortase [Streptomyces sp. NRRL WC-3604]KUL79858.1 sortase [Streptomyces sp. NRRL WC-3605]
MDAGRPSVPQPDPAGPDAPSPHSRRTRRVAVVFWTAIAATVLFTMYSGGGTEDGGSVDAPHAPPAASSAPATAEPAGPDARPRGKHLPRSHPVRLRIPKISVDAPFTDLAIGAGGRLQPPPAHDTNLVGWYAKGASPGETGTSIIAGHVDTATSAAVFAELYRLTKGDRFEVLRADGHKAVFEVDETQTYDKDTFPSDRVYEDTPSAQVRLITCAGDYDRQVRDYTANLVVFAHLV